MSDELLLTEALEMLGYKRGHGVLHDTWRASKTEVVRTEDGRFHVRPITQPDRILFSANTGAEIVRLIRLAQEMFETRY